MLPVWIVAAAVALLGGFLLASSLRSGTPAASPAASSLPPSDAASAGPSAEPSGAASGPPAAVLLAVGDTANCDNTHDDAVAALAATLPGEIALVGDLAYADGSSRAFRTCFDPVWGPIRDRLRPAPGNHDYRTADASVYFAEFGSDAGTHGLGWYAYELGSWKVLVLNSNCDDVDCSAGSAQLTWLAAELTDAPACTLAYWHHPRFSSGEHGDNEVVVSIWSAVAASGVDVVLNGHDHDYERLVADGVREFVIGTGGRSLYRFPGDPSSLTEARADASHGLLQLTLGEGTYAWRFLAADGDLGFTDSGTGACH